MALYELTDAEAEQINKMNVAAQRADMGDVIDDNQEAITVLEGLAVVSGSQAAVYADVDASGIEIATGETGIIGYIVNVSVSGSTVSSNTVNSGSNLWITPVTTGSMSTWTAVVIDDRVDWIVF